MLYLYIVESNDNGRVWVSGIFEDESIALKYLNSITAENMRGRHRIEQADALSFPFYIIEEKRSFTYLNQSETLKRLDDIVQVEDDDHVYFNLYYITQCYQPPEPGIDYMGSLNHVHIDNRLLEWYQQDGLDFLIRNRMA